MKLLKVNMRRGLTSQNELGLAKLFGYTEAFRSYTGMKTLFAIFFY